MGEIKGKEEAQKFGVGMEEMLKNSSGNWKMGKIKSSVKGGKS